MALTAMLSAASAQADEGMWTLYNLPQAVYQQMQDEGFALPYADLYQSEHAVKNAVVNFCGYCSGVAVRPMDWYLPITTAALRPSEAILP